MQIPENAFFEKMKLLLKDDFDSFAACYGEAPFRGVRVNTLKCTAETAISMLGDMEQTPFCKDGYYLKEGGIGKTPLHHAGGIYVQEPSATSAVTLLDVQPGDKVLDLCAAPGGKSTQIAAALNGSGVLVANEYVSSRAKILLSNIERCGVPNAVVVNGRPDQICSAFYGYFDKVLVDAPCSGEGMFRKEPNAVKEWSEQAVLDCAKRQAEILKSARDALCPGGTLVYSTCTFSPEENERQIDAFLKENPDFELVDANEPFGTSLKSGTLDGVEADTEKMVRIFPFDGGEGHFAAKLRFTGDGSSAASEYRPKFEMVPLFADFWKQQFTLPVPERTISVGDQVYIIPDVCPDLQGVRLLRAGIAAGRVVKNRFEPSHNLYTVAKREDVREAVDLDFDDPLVGDYLHGLEITCDSALKGYVGVFVNGVSLGFGKASGGRLKNHYPKGLRNL